MNLTKKQKETYQVIQTFLSEKGYFPTYREISAKMGLKSSAGPSKHIKALIKKGLIKKADRLHRGIRLVNPIERKGPGYANNIKSLYWIIHLQENFLILTEKFNGIEFREYVDLNKINTENELHIENIKRIKNEYNILTNS